MNLIKKFTDENDKSLKEIDQINFDIINNYVNEILIYNFIII